MEVTSSSFDTRNVQIDLQRGVVRGYSKYISFVKHPSFSSGRCDSQAVIKIDFSGPYKGAELVLHYGKSPRLWTLDISDSKTGDGYGGDDGTTSNMAEVQIHNRQMRIYGNMLPGYMDATSDGGLLIKTIDGFVTKGSKATINISDEKLEWARGKIKDFLQSKFLFTLNGQQTEYGEVDYNVFIGFNRVVAGSFRNGSGLCSVNIKLISFPGKYSFYPPLYGILLMQPTFRHLHVDNYRPCSVKRRSNAYAKSFGPCQPALFALADMGRNFKFSINFLLVKE